MRLGQVAALSIAAGVAPLARVHDLCHTAASLMLINGYPVALVAEILGHASAQVTMTTYAHVVPRKTIEQPRNMSDVLPCVAGVGVRTERRRV